MLQLFTDTDCDMTPADAAKYGFRLISMPYSIGETTVRPYEDFDTFDPHAFYDMLREGTLPSTGALGKDVYKAYFEPVFAAGDDILYVHFSAAMTASFDNMKLALAELAVTYPDRRLYEIDTKGITIICRNIAIEAAELYKAGKTAEEIIAWASTEVDHYAQYFFADDLKFFKRSGRVGGLAAMMGTLIGVRPIICMNDEGKMVSVGKEKGRMSALKRLIAYVSELGDDIKSHPIVIGHTDAPELARQLLDMMKQTYGDDLEAEIVAVNPTAGSHCGPNGVGVSFHAIHR